MADFFFHGLESGPWGSKARDLAHVYPDLESPDFSSIRSTAQVEERFAIAEEATRGREGLVIVGSSFGGLIASLLATRYPERVAGLVLCAPALHLPEAHLCGFECPAIIIHGRWDDIVPHSVSAQAARAEQVMLISVNDGHRLAESGGVILAAAQSIKALIASSEA